MNNKMYEGPLIDHSEMYFPLKIKQRVAFKGAAVGQTFKIGRRRPYI